MTEEQPRVTDAVINERLNQALSDSMAHPLLQMYAQSEEMVYSLEQLKSEMMPILLMQMDATVLDKLRLGMLVIQPVLLFDRNEGRDLKLAQKDVMMAILLMRMDVIAHVRLKLDIAE